MTAEEMLLTCWVCVGIGCVLSGIAGSIAANGRNGAIQGFLAGFFLGPLGVIAALALDYRPCCPRCAGRLDGEGHVCQHCRVALEWPNSGGQPILRPENRQPAGEYQRTLADIEQDRVKAEAVALAALGGPQSSKEREWQDLRKPPIAKPLR
jgi:hypothetical protein